MKDDIKRKMLEALSGSAASDTERDVMKKKLKKPDTKSLSGAATSDKERDQFKELRKYLKK